MRVSFPDRGSRRECQAALRLDHPEARPGPVLVLSGCRLPIDQEAWRSKGFRIEAATAAEGKAMAAWLEPPENFTAGAASSCSASP